MKANTFRSYGRYSCVKVEFLPASEEVRVGLGKPYKATWRDDEDGEEVVYKDFSTHRNPAPAVGDKFYVR